MSIDDSKKAVKKFTFSANFSAPRQKKPVEPSFTLAELEAARAEAYAEGEAEGRKAILESTEKTVADASVLIARSLHDLFSEDAARVEQMKIDAATLAHAFARKIAPKALGEAPLDEITAMINDYVALCYNEARIVIRVPDAMVDPLKTLSNRIAGDQGYMGKIVILGDDRMQGSDCKIEWADGGAERSEDKTIYELDRLVARYIEARRRSLKSLATVTEMEQDNA